jgi:hypothetical protein
MDFVALCESIDTEIRIASIRLMVRRLDGTRSSIQAPRQASAGAIRA